MTLQVLRRINQMIRWNREKHQDTIYIDKKMIESFLPDNPIIIDCGAHIGLDAVEFASIHGSRIFAFEAVPHIFDKLKRNTKNLENVYCYNLALGWFDGEAEIHVSGGDSDGSSSLLKPKKHLDYHPTVTFNETMKVQCKRIDTWADENNITKVDLLWLDMQGAEQKMLMASDKILKGTKLIHTEVSKDETYEGVDSYKNFKRFLLKKGFKVEVEAIPKGHYGGNVLFIRK